MSRMTQTHVAFCTLMTMVLSYTHANADGGLLNAQTGSPCRASICDHSCSLKVEESEKERTCYEIESKVICIPRVVFPWQKGRNACDSCDTCDGLGCSSCVHNGATVRRICVAVPKKYSCPTCKYSWEAKKKGSHCDSLPFGEDVFAPSTASISHTSAGNTQDVQHTQEFEWAQQEKSVGVSMRFTNFFRGLSGR